MYHIDGKVVSTFPCTKPGCVCGWEKMWHDMGPAPRRKRSAIIGSILEDDELSLLRVIAELVILAAVMVAILSLGRWAGRGML